jgi:pimeloyl-ACP methyl ester carboxylesterase
VVAPDLPSEDDSAGVSDHADAVVDAVGDRRDVIVVAQSLGGFVAPLVCARVPVSLLVLVTAMVPAPGESAGEWFDNTGWAQARRDDAARDGRVAGDDVDVMTEFFHDVPPDVVAEALERGERAQADPLFREPWPLEAWPNVPAEFMRRVVRERLGLTPDEIASGHLPALSRPQELVERLEAYRAGT